jgi:acyl-CoA thioester hydrolase
MVEHTTQFRVRYKETDQMGVAYYSNYFVWFEVGRTELLRSIGLPYSRIEHDMKISLIIADARCSYKAPVRYDDLITVHTCITETGRSSVKFSCKISRDNTLVAEGSTIHVCIGSNGKPKRLPVELKEALL